MPLIVPIVEFPSSPEKIFHPSLPNFAACLIFLFQRIVTLHFSTFLIHLTLSLLEITRPSLQLHHAELCSWSEILRPTMLLYERSIQLSSFIHTHSVDTERCLATTHRLSSRMPEGARPGSSSLSRRQRIQTFPLKFMIYTYTTANRWHRTPLEQHRSTLRGLKAFELI